MRTMLTYDVSLALMGAANAIQKQTTVWNARMGFIGWTINVLKIVLMDTMKIPIMMGWVFVPLVLIFVATVLIKHSVNHVSLIS